MSFSFLFAFGIFTGISFDDFIVKWSASDEVSVFSVSVFSFLSAPAKFTGHVG